MSDRSLYLLVDYRGAFYSSMENMQGLCSVDLEALEAAFRRGGWRLHVKRFSEIDLRQDVFADRYVLYQSSEDPGLHYKQYLEDLLLGLQVKGAHLIPGFSLFRAHHNKAFMEILRDVSPVDGLRSIRSRVYGTYEDFARDETRFPAVIKGAEGAGSLSVHLLRNARDKAKYGKALAWAGDRLHSAKEILKRRVRASHVPRSIYRKRFVVQEFLDGLEYDFKILVYGGKYYALKRRNRPNDFRASGSGLLEWPEEIPEPALDLAREVFEGLDVPYLSADIAWDGSRAHVLEFQCVSFGPLTMQQSKFYFEHGTQGWVRRAETPDLARELARSTLDYINRHERSHRSEGAEDMRSHAA